MWDLPELQSNWILAERNRIPMRKTYQMKDNSIIMEYRGRQYPEIF